MGEFQKLCQLIPFGELSKAEQAKIFLWFSVKSSKEEGNDLSSVTQLFQKASLPVPSSTRVREYFRKDREVHRGSVRNSYRLVRQAIERLDGEYGSVFESDAEVTVAVKANIKQTPFLSEAEVNGASQMAQLYIVMHCYENSARKLIEKVLSDKIGSNWWDVAANTKLKNKVATRRQSETKHKWLSPRGKSPLFYVDWGDLLTIIRKYEQDFLPYIKDYKFVELRFEEMERLRNIIAHHGYLDDDEDFQRVVISFRDWSKQIT